MASFGQGNSDFMTGEEAVSIARDPISPGGRNIPCRGRTSPGRNRRRLPIDYGFQPTRGELTGSSVDEFVLKRIDERAGGVAVHFPRIGFHQLGRKLTVGSM